MTHLLADVRLVCRTWRNAPGFAAVAIASIALGIGATAAVFRLVDQVLRRMLPVNAPQEFVQVSFNSHRYGDNRDDGSELSMPVCMEFKDNATVFSGMLARFGAAFTVGGAGRAERANGELVSGSYFPVLGVGAAIGRTNADAIEIVGVVRDSKYTDIRDAVQRQVFFAFFESPSQSSFTAYVRGDRPAEALLAIVRQTVAELDPALPVHGTRALATQVALSLSRERMVATMTTAFGSLAALLAVIGLYGVMSYTVARRTREIGVRVALGATSRRIGWLVIREVLVIAAAGVALALPLAWWLGRYVSSQLYGVTPSDPLAIGAAAALMITVAVVAGLIPSSRAARLDPTVALRQD